MVSRHVLYHACWARAWRCQEMSESTLVCITQEERCTGSHGIRLALARRDGSARARTQMCTRQAKQRAGHQAMTASRGRRCARSALMRPTTHRVKVEETSDIGSPLEPPTEGDLYLSLACDYLAGKHTNTAHPNGAFCLPLICAEDNSYLRRICTYLCGPVALQTFDRVRKGHNSRSPHASLAQPSLTYP